MIPSITLMIGSYIIAKMLLIIIKDISIVNNTPDGTPVKMECGWYLSAVAVICIIITISCIVSVYETNTSIQNSINSLQKAIQSIPNIK